jgi:isocitrate/isopropylmalate dehydrogenase
MRQPGAIPKSVTLLISFDEAWRPNVVMAEAPHGTAPSLQGKNIANPMAMFLAGAALLRYAETTQATQVARSIYESVFEAVYEGHRTPDLGGSSTTTEFTDEVIRRVKGKLEVWQALGS